MSRIAVLGMPNTGKSTFFNRLTGSQAHIGNWPGITVDLMMATLKLGDELVEVVDLPGIYDLRGFSEDEVIVRRFLEKTPLDLILIILNTTQIDRQLILPLQVKHSGLPAVLLLNMADEAKRFGVQVQPDVLSQRLGLPVQSISAKYGLGYQDAIASMTAALQQNHPRRSALTLDDQLLQAYRFMLFTLLYVPCLSTVAVLKSESKSLRFALLSVGWSLGLAWLTSLVFYQGARLLGF